MNWTVGADIVWVPELLNHFTRVRVKKEGWKSAYTVKDKRKLPPHFGVITKVGEYWVEVELID